MGRKLLGPAGEKHATRFLKRRGYRILENNFRTRTGEIDLIARDGDVLVFIEVKTRTSTLFGQPFEAVNAIKRTRMAGAALAYLKKFREPPPCRFDVVSILCRDGEFEIDLIRDAFEMQGSERS